MIGAIHDELDAFGDSAELADDQLVADEGVVVENILEEVLRAFGVVVIGVIADNDIGIINEILDEPDLRETFHGVLVSGGWAVLHSTIVADKKPAATDFAAAAG